MKKYISIILAVVIALSTTVFAFAALRGDTDGDGKVGSTDARNLLQYTAGLKKATAEEIKKYDLTGDGKISSVDARRALQIAAGIYKAEELPTEKPTNPGVNVGEGSGDGQISWDDIVQVP